ncbi:uncharacterized protein LOC105898158 [Clupea harengus]|uniref:Uncharacterized protein LOC105898158 n=1 Tax=Clupea harengus TaxID=7950 RepID=A0A6P8G706_CLUHA|nr:uncharacterized protein LOC105898158 [Clupea harengus]
MIETIRLFQLVLILEGVSNVRMVAPPDNVTILCQNGRNIAYWNHTGPSLDPVLFSVAIKGYWDGATLIQSNTSEHHIDMSLATPPTKKGIYIFTLAACDGSSVSDEVDVIFSYDRDFSSDVACFMDLPRPNVTVGTNLVKFGFENPASALVPVDEGEPYDYEGNYTEGHDEEEVQFYYVVYINNEKQLDFECSPVAEICYGEILRSADSGNCALEIEGYLDAVRYKSSTNICNSASEKGSWPIYLLVVSCIMVLVTLVGILLGARKVVKTMIERASVMMPGSLKSKPVAGSQCILQPESSVASQVQTGCTPLLQSPEDSPDVTPTAVTPSSCQEKTHFRIPAPATSSEDQPGDGYEARLKAEPLPQLRPQGCDVSNDDCYMQRARITNNTSDSPRASVVIEIAPGDSVSGYGPR